jgi:hypothetical protein
MRYPKLTKALDEQGERAVQLAKLELGTYKPRPSRTSTWRGMSPTSTKIKMKKRRAVATGKLQKSIRYDLDMKDMPSVNMYFEDYGKYVEEGRKAGKGMPLSALKKWIISGKKLRFFNREKRQFEAMTPSKLNSLMFMINRSIKVYGILPNPFMRPAFVRSMTENFEAIEKAFAKDIEEDLNE